MYKISGRYVDEENNTTNYYLVSSTGEKIKASVKYTTELASRGMISNAKVQIKRDGTILLRGNLVNLNRVPTIRKNVAGLKVVGESKIVGKIIKKDKVAGYVVESANGELSKLSYKKVIALTSGNYIGNASLAKNDKNDVIIKVDSANLDEYFMDAENKIFKKGSTDNKFRATMQNNGGIIDGEPFDRGDWLVCKYKGEIEIIRHKDFEDNYELLENESVAICDLHIDDIKLSIERFDTTVEDVSNDEIKSWLIYKHK